MGNQVTVVVLEVNQHVCDGVVDRTSCAFADICEVHFLDCGNNFLQKSLIHSCHLLEQTHSLSVCNSHVEIRVGGCAVLDDKRTRASQVDTVSG